MSEPSFTTPVTPPEGYVTSKEAIEMLEVSYRQFWRLAHEQAKFPSMYKEGKFYFFKRSEIEEEIRQRATANDEKLGYSAFMHGVKQITVEHFDSVNDFVIINLRQTGQNGVNVVIYEKDMKSFVQQWRGALAELETIVGN